MQKLAVKVPFEGFYNSSHDAMFDGWFERETDYLESDHGATREQTQEIGELFFSEVNWKAAHIAYCKEYVSAVEDLLADDKRKPVTLEFVEMTSPREYNFATDCIYANVTVQDLQFMLDTISAQAWADHVKECCTSYSGFMSFHSPDVTAAEWQEPLEQWGEARLGMILEAYIIHIIDGRNINEALSAFELMERLESNGLIDSIMSDAASAIFWDKFNLLVN